MFLRFRGSRAAGGVASGREPFSRGRPKAERGPRPPVASGKTASGSLGGALVAGALGALVGLEPAGALASGTEPRADGGGGPPEGGGAGPELASATGATEARDGTRGPAIRGSAAMGAGAIGRDPASALDLHLDVAGDRYALGLGGRFHYTARGGFRREDWDDLSDFLGIMRYAAYERGDEDGGVSAGAGQLGDIRHGHGTVMAGFAPAVSLDRSHLGVHARGHYEELAGELVVDDVARPRIFALRSAAQLSDHLRLGVSFSADVRAPAAGGEAAVGIAALEGEWRGGAGGERGDRFRGRLYADAATAAGLGAGLHVGAGASAGIGRSGARVAARSELRLAAGGYIPGYFSPLYERDRHVLDPHAAPGGAAQLDLARTGGLGGAAPLGELSAEWPGLGRATVTYAGRPQLSDHVIARLEAPHFRDVQAAAWGALARGAGPGRGGALAAEVRVRLPEPLAATAHLARLYRDGPSGPTVGTWKVIAALALETDFTDP